VSERVYRVVQYGMGPIGQELARLALERRSYELVGAIDIDPAKVGRDVGELLGLEGPVGVLVRADAEAVLAETRPDCVLHTTGSYLARVFPQLESIVRAGCNVVSTCEELSFPAAGHPELAARLDGLAREYGVTVLGTGVNPGHVMDTLPLFFLGCRPAGDRSASGADPERVARRKPLQEKIGSGKTVEEFQQLAAGRNGAPRGAARIGLSHRRGARLAIERYEERIEPVIAERRIETRYFTVEPGRVCGVDQLGRAFVEGEERITLHLRMYLDADPAYDRVLLEGTTPLELVIPGGLQGDRQRPRSPSMRCRGWSPMPPGLVTMVDLPIITVRS
jgi:hypothetical protein